MDILIEFMKVILPVCITGFITFLITKYSCNKNIPLDKLEITYNRVYYPLYCLIKENKDICEIIKKSEFYLQKYKKYVDRTTLVAFNYLKKKPNNKKAYSNYEDNILKFNCKIRRRLGYLETNILGIYAYSAPSDKCAIRMIVELLGMYIALILSQIIRFEKFQTVMYVIFL